MNMDSKMKAVALGAVFLIVSYSRDIIGKIHLILLFSSRSLCVLFTNPETLNLTNLHAVKRRKQFLNCNNLQFYSLYLQLSNK